MQVWNPPSTPVSRNLNSIRELSEMKTFTLRLFCLSTLALGIASAATPYDITLLDNVSVGKTELKAGDYKVEMQGDKAVFTIGKKSFAVPATLGKNDQPFASTVFVSQHSKLKEIDLGGTQDKIIFGGTEIASAK
jgi:hypothetical protein